MRYCDSGRVILSVAGSEPRLVLVKRSLEYATLNDV